MNTNIVIRKQGWGNHISIQIIQATFLRFGLEALLSYLVNKYKIRLFRMGSQLC